MIDGQTIRFMTALFLLLLPACRGFGTGGQGGGASWALPAAAPCELVTQAEAEALIGPLRSPPAAGGTAVDGSACAYVAAAPVVVTLGVISTNAFEMRKYEAGNRKIGGVGDEAFLTAANALGDARLFARQGGRAVLVTVTAGQWDAAGIERQRVAETFAVKALERAAEPR